MSSPPMLDDSIDPIFNVRGWWVTFQRVFLFLPPPGPESDFTQITLQNGAACYGFNANAIAEKFVASGFPIDASGLVLNNKIGALTLAESAGTVTPGAADAIDFTFELPTGHKVRAEVKTAPIAGSA